MRTTTKAETPREKKEREIKERYDKFHKDDVANILAGKKTVTEEGLWAKKAHELDDLKFKAKQERRESVRADYENTIKIRTDELKKLEDNYMTSSQKERAKELLKELEDAIFQERKNKRSKNNKAPKPSASLSPDEVSKKHAVEKKIFKEFYENGTSVYPSVRQKETIRNMKKALKDAGLNISDDDIKKDFVNLYDMSRGM